MVPELVRLDMVAELMLVGLIVEDDLDHKRHQRMMMFVQSHHQQDQGMVFVQSHQKDQHPPYIVVVVAAAVERRSQACCHAVVVVACWDRPNMPNWSVALLQNYHDWRGDQWKHHGAGCRTRNDRVQFVLAAYQNYHFGQVVAYQNFQTDVVDKDYLHRRVAWPAEGYPQCYHRKESLTSCRSRLIRNCVDVRLGTWCDNSLAEASMEQHQQQHHHHSYCYFGCRVESGATVAHRHQQYHPWCYCDFQCGLVESGVAWHHDCLD
mmetsp:Transcript_635/g.1050  ORF Transcript_635/g.1050 Transcript_635/m.1050 type:complete len:264 (-) Transcript_635:784-1575(-)